MVWSHLEPKKSLLGGGGGDVADQIAQVQVFELWELDLLDLDMISAWK